MFPKLLHIARYFKVANFFLEMDNVNIYLGVNVVDRDKTINLLITTP